MSTFTVIPVPLEDINPWDTLLMGERSVAVARVVEVERPVRGVAGPPTIRAHIRLYSAEGDVITEADRKAIAYRIVEPTDSEWLTVPRDLARVLLDELARPMSEGYSETEVETAARALMNSIEGRV